MTNTTYRKVLLVLVLALCFSAQADDNAGLALARVYVEALNTRSVDIIPLAEQVTFYGPVLEQPIAGKTAVREFLEKIVPSISSAVLINAYGDNTGACVETNVVFKSSPNTPLDEVACIKVAKGLITSIRLYFDPRPLLSNKAE